MPSVNLPPPGGRDTGPVIHAFTDQVGTPLVAPQKIEFPGLF